MTWRRLAGPFALLACCGVFAACGSSDEPTESADEGRHRDRVAGGDVEHRREQRGVLRSGDHGQAARAAVRHA